MADPTRAGNWRSLMAVVLALVVGLLPKIVGRRVDPYDAYNEQFAPIWKADVLLDHARILALDCLPRLIAGHRLPGFAAEPGGIGPDGRALPGGGDVASVSAVTLGLGLFLLAVPVLASRIGIIPTRAGRAVGRALGPADLVAGRRRGICIESQYL